MSAIVSIVRVDESVPAAVREAMERADWKRFITRGAAVSLKVNLGWDMFLPGAVSAPWVVEGVIQTIRDHVGSIAVVESDQVLVDCEVALRQTLIDRVCRRYGVPFVNMSKGQFETVRLPDPLVLKEVRIPEILTRTETITLPVMKTHAKTGITGSLKNQWGCLEKLRHSFHPVVNEALVDINRLVKPRFAVMDATVGMEGNGPKSGRPKIADRVLASGDLVALDTVQAQVMGLDPAAIEHVQNCARAGLGTSDLSQIEVVGEERWRSLNLGFRPAEHNAVSFVEGLLRSSVVKPLVFDTPLFDLSCRGAIAYYWLWYYVRGEGRRLRDEILANPKYGPQWREETWS